jgi:hypothetical protein
MLDTAKAPLKVSSHARNWNIDANTWSHDNLDFPGNIIQQPLYSGLLYNSITNYRFHHRQQHRRRYATAATILVQRNSNVRVHLAVRAANQPPFTMATMLTWVECLSKRFGMAAGFGVPLRAIILILQCRDKFSLTYHTEYSS